MKLYFTILVNIAIYLYICFLVQNGNMVHYLAAFKKGFHAAAIANMKWLNKKQSW